MVRGSGGWRHDFMTRAGRASPNAGPAARRRGRSWIPSCRARLGGRHSRRSARRFTAFFPLRRPPRRGRKANPAPRPGRLDQIAGLDQAPAGKSREWLVIHRSTSRAEKPSIFEGALLARSTAITRSPMWSSSPVGMPAGPDAPRYRASDRRSFGSPASFSNSA